MNKLMLSWPLQTRIPSITYVPPHSKINDADGRSLWEISCSVQVKITVLKIMENLPV